MYAKSEGNALRTLDRVYRSLVARATWMSRWMVIRYHSSRSLIWGLICSSFSLG